MTAVLVTNASPAAAAAEAGVPQTPVYLCDNIAQQAPKLEQGVIGYVCEGQNGAVMTGHFDGESIIRTRSGTLKFKCRYGGSAHVPYKVEAVGCVPDSSAPRAAAS
ncbi:hypothetical protein [Nonomuraea sp. GTA35]|uniref:hypothetical protein n=1 Tax=Nonomuraea sp. GTA35 TaxID=1676746 RepID=UPI0035C1F011